MVPKRKAVRSRRGRATVSGDERSSRPLGNREGGAGGRTGSQETLGNRPKIAGLCLHALRIAGGKLGHPRSPRLSAAAPAAGGSGRSRRPGGGRGLPAGGE